MRQMGLGTSRCIQTNHEGLWADEVFHLQYRLLVMNEIKSSQAINPKNLVKFHGILVDHLLYDRELNHLRKCGMSKRAPFLPGGGLYSVEDS